MGGLDNIDPNGDSPGDPSLEEPAFWRFNSWYSILLITNAVLGLVLLEVSWYRSRRFRNPIPELESKMAAFNRIDAQRWNKLLLYPGAMTICIPRFLIGVLCGLCMVIFSSVLLIGQPMNMPITGCRKVVLRWINKLFVTLFAFFCNFSILSWKYVSEEEVNFYEEYLGPKELREENKSRSPRNDLEHNQGYSTNSDSESAAGIPLSYTRIPARGPGPVSTVVCNHMGWSEILCLIASPLHPGFTPKSDLANVPIIGQACRGLGSLFVARGASDEAKETIV